jgi:hypothetical protein
MWLHTNSHYPRLCLRRRRRGSSAFPPSHAV